MAKTTNGTSQQRFEIVRTEHPEQCYVVFQASEARPPDPQLLPVVLSKTVSAWVAERPGLEVLTALPIVLDGTTIAVHLWYEREPEE